ncbi:unnamed protein product [Notodromas monacha]|uniref:Uncharacterized protein n=1 Tax=Notodromas monacha TaxID=399045 RepID=A0A7R9BCE2_9CRUS|nr:unnamed protein product [Notodromas monacha]CAG0912690.1 unnamed protein product [Notodromas monacha]
MKILPNVDEILLCLRRAAIDTQASVRLLSSTRSAPRETVGIIRIPSLQGEGNRACTSSDPQWFKFNVASSAEQDGPHCSNECVQQTKQQITEGAFDSNAFLDWWTSGKVAPLRAGFAQYEIKLRSACTLTPSRDHSRRDGRGSPGAWKQPSVAEEETAWMTRPLFGKLRTRAKLAHFLFPRIVRCQLICFPSPVTSLVSILTAKAPLEFRKSNSFSSAAANRFDLVLQASLPHEEIGTGAESADR